MKAKLPFGMSLRLAMQGKVITKVLTVFLCAFSFALFALSSTGYMYDQVDFLTRSFLTLQKVHTPGILFSHFDNYAQSWLFPTERIDYIEQETGLDFVYCFLHAEDSVYRFYAEYETESPERMNETILSGSAAAYEDCGFQLMAGRYPEADDEIVITLSRFQDFQKLGYAYNDYHFVHIRDGVVLSDVPYSYQYNSIGDRFIEIHSGRGSVPVPGDYTGYVYVEFKERGEPEEIRTYDDIIGKKIICFGDPQTGSLGKENIYDATIVGVADDSEAHCNIYTLRRVSLRSESWRETFAPSVQDDVECLAAGPTDDYDLARTCVEVTLNMIEETDSSHPDYETPNGQIGVYPLTSLINRTAITHPNFWDEKNVLIAFGAAAGLLFGIVSVLLCWHLMTSTLNLQRIKIGILRSMGAGEADVIRIILIEALLVAVGAFLLGLVFTLAGYYWVVKPMSFFEMYGVSRMVLNGWNILFLAGLSFIVPFLCTIVPTKKFLKQSIVDNISGNLSKR